MEPLMELHVQNARTRKPVSFPYRSPAANASPEPVPSTASRNGSMKPSKP
jgi:hypothetical protein